MAIDVNWFKPFKTTLKKERDNAMVKNIHCESNKCTLVSWVDKILDQSLSKKNINSGFKDTRIWPLNLKAMDHKTKPFKVYTSTPTDISNKTMKVLMIQIMGKRSGEKVELLHNWWT